MEGEYLEPCFPLIDMQLKDKINAAQKCLFIVRKFFGPILVFHFVGAF